jgi:hypothetical protein
MMPISYEREKAKCQSLVKDRDEIGNAIKAKDYDDLLNISDWPLLMPTLFFMALRNPPRQ